MKFRYFKSLGARYVLALMIIVAIVMFGVLIHIPQHGLPNQFDVTIPPKHLLWKGFPGERTWNTPGLSNIGGYSKY